MLRKCTIFKIVEPTQTTTQFLVKYIAEKGLFLLQDDNL
jgi:hypothetical protein